MPREGPIRLKGEALGVPFDFYDREGDLIFRIADTGAITLGPSGGTIGLFGVTPAARPAAYTPTNVTTDRAFDADTVAVAELADVVGTIIADLQTLGILQ